MCVLKPLCGGRYHSHADEAADTYAGLMGAIVVSRRGASRADGTPADVDRCAPLTPRCWQFFLYYAGGILGRNQ